MPPKQNKNEALEKLITKFRAVHFDEEAEGISREQNQYLINLISASKPNASSLKTLNSAGSETTKNFLLFLHKIEIASKPNPQNLLKDLFNAAKYMPAVKSYSEEGGAELMKYILDISPEIFSCVCRMSGTKGMQFSEEDFVELMALFGAEIERNGERVHIGFDGLGMMMKVRMNEQNALGKKREVIVKKEKNRMMDPMINLKMMSIIWIQPIR